jgi:nucleoside-diphosphate-sugar epimerase
VTGYIGGSVLASIVNRQPDYDVTAYVRKTPAGFTEKYPNVKLLHGTWDDSALLTKAASEVDIVVQCGSSDHLGAVTALLFGVVAGAKKRGGAAGYYIHLSGTGILSDFKDPDGKSYRGRENPKRYSDVADIGEVTSRSSGSLHQHTDLRIQEYADKYDDVMRTAIICPPDIYGRGYGPVKTSSVYFPAFVKEIKKLGYAFYCNEGANLRGWVHIDDLMQVYVKIIEAAAIHDKNVTWGRDGYFFTTTQEASQKDLAAATGKLLHAKGIIDSAEPRQVSESVIAGTLSERPYPELGFYMFAGNSRAVADRAKKELAFMPRAPSLWDTLQKDVEDALAEVV